MLQFKVKDLGNVVEFDEAACTCAQLISFTCVVVGGDPPAR